MVSPARKVLCDPYPEKCGSRYTSSASAMSFKIQTSGIPALPLNGEAMLCLNQHEDRLSESLAVGKPFRPDH